MSATRVFFIFLLCCSFACTQFYPGFYGPAYIPPPMYAYPAYPAYPPYGVGYPGYYRPYYRNPIRSALRGALVGATFGLLGKK